LFAYEYYLRLRIEQTWQKGHQEQQKYCEFILFGKMFSEDFGSPPSFSFGPKA